MRTVRKFSIKARIKNFSYALHGIRSFLKLEHNARVHLLATVILVLMFFIIPLTRNEIALLVLVAGGVWAAEIFNTAIERVMDFVSPEFHPAVKTIKDLSAAAVLIMAIVALICACLIFIPKF